MVVVVCRDMDVECGEFGGDLLCCLRVELLLLVVMMLIEVGEEFVSVGWVWSVKVE